MAVNESHPLYDACVGYMVAEKSEADSWEKVARFIQTKIENGEGDAVQIKAQFTVVEQQIKQDFKITTLPTAWRTAKSSALAAARAGINLFDVAGNVKGKSAIEDEVKVKSGDSVPRNMVATAVVMLNKASRLLTGLRVTAAERDALNAAVIELGDACGSMIDA